MTEAAFKALLQKCAEGCAASLRAQSFEVVLHLLVDGRLSRLRSLWRELARNHSNSCTLPDSSRLRKIASGEWRALGSINVNREMARGQSRAASR